MAADQPGFWARLGLALVLFWKVLLHAALAAQVRALLQAGSQPQTSRGDAAELGAQGESRAEPVAKVEPDPTTALQLLGIMQREGRFVDFLEEDVSRFSDAEVGAAARVVHEGCRRGLKDYLVLEPVRPEAEGEAVILERGFDPARTRVTGNVVGEPPFHGRLAHHGWQVAEIRLPSLANRHDPRIVAPAEVEL
jgi:hypothetical protein